LISTPTELHALYPEFDRERPNVLVVVGTGISFGATGEARASWSGLLEHGVETLRTQATWNDETANANLTLIKNAFSSTFDLDEVLTRAESVTKALGAPDGTNYGSWLADAIGSLKAREDRTATLDAIKQLEQAGALILTTNYDNLLTDATGLSPVTWQDHGEFLRVLNRDREGILHIHGHWSQPSSVILGRKSYEHILNAPALQDLFKSIWLHWSWLYVGCGNGLEDPNVGRLLRWGHDAFGESARKHYFLAKEQDAADLLCRPDKPANLVPVGYRDHAELPNHLRALTPRQRPCPFVELGPTSGPVRKPLTSPQDIPLPSWQELLNGDVPTMTADATVSAALRTHGWALVYDVASIGKTTLALRLAAGPEYRNAPAFYLDLAQIGDGDDVETANIFAAMRRLAHTKALIILDNVHWAPQVTHKVWEWWLGRPRTNRLLMMATHIQYTSGTSGDDALTVIENHPSNPAITLRPVAADLPPILNYIVKRITGSSKGLQPPEQALAVWYATFGNQMGAFAAAVTNRHQNLRLGQLDLPVSAAADWIYNRHFRPLNKPARENLLCLSAFATLELDVAELALPHSNQISPLLRNGLVERRERGRERHRFYALREPDWGTLLLGAIDPQPGVEEEILLGTACRHAMMALYLSSRLFRRNASDCLAELWQRLGDPGTAPQIIDQLTLLPLSYALRFQAHAAKNGRQELIDGLYDAWQADPDRLAERAFETPLGDLATFIDTAMKHQREPLVKGLWTAFDAERAFETPLGDLATFINTAMKHQWEPPVKRLWTALDAEPDRLAERAFETPLQLVATFIDTAMRHQGEPHVKRLWTAFDDEPDRLAERAFETPLGDLTTFINTAMKYQREPLVKRLWTAFDDAPDRLAERAFETPLDHLAAFIDTATKHQREPLVKGLWMALEKKPNKLQAAATELDGNSLRGFLMRAPKAIGRLAIANLDVADWTFNSHSKKAIFWGAPKLATQFANLGRPDLATLLRRYLLHSADPKWFAVPHGAILDVAILLNATAASEQSNVEAFVGKVCSPAWLTRQYSGRTNDAVIAGAFVLLALSQPPSILGRFWSPALTERVERVLAGLAGAEGDALGGCVQFLGAAQLIGWRTHQPLTAANLNRIAQLPLDVLPHRPEADGIESYQRNLWFGLRAVASLATASLYLGRAVIDETLKRWQVTLQDNVAEPEGTSHRLDHSMVSWLEACARDGRGFLLPSQEPLWRIIGFDH